MNRIRVLFVLGALFFTGACRAQEVLIVADEFHAMQVLGSQLESDAKVTTRIVGQTEIPPSLASYRAVIVYLHGELQPKPEQAFIEYANNGGKLILLHHTISSRKRENKSWFTFLHIELPEGPLTSGGYTYFDPVSFEVVNLAQGNAITTRNVPYNKTIAYADTASAAERTLSGTEFADTEVYLNHKLSGPRTILLGMKYVDPKTKTVFMQNTAGWLLETGKGSVFYFMMGHRAEDFENATYRKILSNAIEYQK